MQSDVDVMLCDIISTQMDIEPERVVVYAENYDPPKDDGLYIVVSTRRGKPISNVRRFDYENNREIQSLVTYDTFDIDITSKNRDAIDRKEEVLMALNSFYSEDKQAENSVKIFKMGEILDLSFIEAASALKRFRIPVMVSNIKTKTKVTDNYYDKYKTNEEVVDE